MLEVRKVSKNFQSRTVVKDVSFVLKPSQITGYIGPNGAGKTTTARMLTGMLSPSSGSILFDNCDIFAERVEYLRRLGYVPEQAHLYPHLTAVEYLQLVGRLRQISERSLRRRIDGFLEVFSLSRASRRPLSAFSKGMCQKVLISAALLHDPDILILDEPLSGLDVNSMFLFRAILRLLAREGKIVLYSSHVLDSVEKLCSRVLILSEGRIVADRAVNDLQRTAVSVTLEDVFSRLVSHENGEETATRILEIMKL